MSDNKNVASNEVRFAELSNSPDPQRFTVKHGSDKQAYTILDGMKDELQPTAFPTSKDAEPIMTLAEAFGNNGDKIVADIQASGQIVFHAAGDTGNTVGPKDEDLVADKMVSDFDETHPAQVPSFFYHLGDVVYSFGEAQYYYDQFYDPYRNYPAPIFAIPGNHDGMVAPGTTTPTLAAFLENFCATGAPARTPEAGQLSRTAQRQPAVYFTLEAPYVRILGLYSNCLEDPGVISDQGGTYRSLDQSQLRFIETALNRVKSEKFTGAVLIAVHHPPYVAQSSDGGKRPVHGSSSKMLAEIDAICERLNVWPHAFLSGHAHNKQRFTRRIAGREIPFLVCGNAGHHINKLTRPGEPALRAPQAQPTLGNGKDQITLENYDDTDFGYLRIVVTPKQLRIEYHPASDGIGTKTPDDAVTVDLATGTLAHYSPPQ